MNQRSTGCFWREEVLRPLLLFGFSPLCPQIVFDGRKFFVHCFFQLFCFQTLHTTERYLANTSEDGLYDREKFYWETALVWDQGRSKVFVIFLPCTYVQFVRCIQFLAPQGALGGPATSLSVRPLIAFDCIAVIVFFGWLVGPTSLWFSFSPDGQYVQFVWMTWPLLH